MSALRPLLFAAVVILLGSGSADAFGKRYGWKGFTWSFGYARVPAAPTWGGYGGYGYSAPVMAAPMMSAPVMSAPMMSAPTGCFGGGYSAPTYGSYSAPGYYSPGYSGYGGYGYGSYGYGGDPASAFSIGSVLTILDLVDRIRGRLGPGDDDIDELKDEVRDLADQVKSLQRRVDEFKPIDTKTVEEELEKMRTDVKTLKEATQVEIKKLIQRVEKLEDANP